MPKKVDSPTTVPAPGPDAFTTPTDAPDTFTPLTPEQERPVWRELRELLAGLVDRPATPRDRDQADGILRRLGLAPELSPLFLAAVREARELEATIVAADGAEAKAATIHRELRHYLAATPSTPEAAGKIAEARERLSGEYLATTRLVDASTRAHSGLDHLRAWLWPLFTDETPFKEEKDFLGNVRRHNSGALSTTIVPPKTNAAARDLGLDPYVIDSWRHCRQPELAPARRRYKTVPSAFPTTTAPMGRNL